MKRQQERDLLKDTQIKQNGMKIIRFKYNEPLNFDHILGRLTEEGIMALRTKQQTRK